MKRTTGIIAALAAVGLTLTGCSTAASQNRGSAAKLVTKTAEAAYPTGPVHLVMWWWGEQEAPGAKKWLAETVAAYEQKHHNVKIDTVLQTTDGLIPAFQAAAAAKQGPDLQYFGEASTLNSQRGVVRSCLYLTTSPPTNSSTT